MKVKIVSNSPSNHSKRKHPESCYHQVDISSSVNLTVVFVVADDDESVDGDSHHALAKEIMFRNKIFILPSTKRPHSHKTRKEKSDTSDLQGPIFGKSIELKNKK